MTLDDFKAEVLALFPHRNWEIKKHCSGFEAVAGADLINWYPGDPQPWAFTINGQGGTGATLAQAWADFCQEVGA